jgi:hypothetical protein
MKKRQDTPGALGFLDGLVARFRRGPEQTLSEKAPTASSQDLRREFEAALEGLTRKIEEQRRRDQEALDGGERGEKTAAERAAERAKRMDVAHRAIREDVVAMHACLGTGLGNDDLTDLRVFLEEVDALAAPGAESHELLPRARYRIAKRLGHEAGELVLARLRLMLEKAGVAWPDPIRYHPSATAEDIEAARRRRFSEMREQFLARGLPKTAERVVGVVGAWGADYPDRGSPLWQEAVLEAVAAGLQAQLLRAFVERLRSDREIVEAETDRLIGPQLAAVQKVLESGVASVEEATRAAAGALRVIDEVIPDLAWKHLRSVLPAARGGVSPP